MNWYITLTSLHALSTPVKLEQEQIVSYSSLICISFSCQCVRCLFMAFGIALFKKEKETLCGLKSLR